ncbi:luciferin 4-monooxygenase-like [Spodoptera frugiperda]|uniref:Luciferin 4-monooxygenase-like n=1 Tax=Spodoptera frugiperda TaxID=7108 RepID=A0A9R0DTS4_SPOFR|nr:luciferin 4-monooxygenase-like [Spodoptera frugiperda]
MRPLYDAIHWYMADVGARVVAKTGIPSDRHHLGKLILHSLQDDPDFIFQIDGATGESETNISAAFRSIQCAVSLTKMGLKKGDVMVLMGPNHIHFSVPHHAALFLGVMMAPVDVNLVVNELKQIFATNRPKIIICQNEKTKDIEKALNLADVEAKIITFNESSDYTTLAQILQDADDEEVANFKPTDFDPEETVAFLPSTSGTTGIPKTAMLTHKNLNILVPYMWSSCTKFPTPTKLMFLTSPPQWLSAGFQHLYSPILKYTRLQTSAELTPDHFAELVNKYKPTCLMTSPTMVQTMIAKAKCDFTCFEFIAMGGSAVPHDLVDQTKKIADTDKVIVLYGITELGGLVVQHEYPPANGSFGKPVGCVDVKIVDTETQEEILEPNVPGEIWFRGPNVFKGYYNRPEATKETLTEDGWFKTGDIFYRDESWNLFFVDRYKSLLKYKSHQVSPVEVEEVIMKHPGVMLVGVTGIPDRECGDLVVACVVPKPGCSPTAQEIEDLVTESLSDSKRLRGGVIFMKELPTTSTSKINRQKLKELVANLPRQ